MAYRRSLLSSWNFRETCSAASLLPVLRVLRAWNQTGQKYAGEADIAKTILSAHNFLLWSLVYATYADVIQRLSRRAIPWASRHLSTAACIALGIAALQFKTAFINADAPELLFGLELLVPRSMEKVSLISQARAVFSIIATMVVLTSLPTIYQKILKKGSTPGKMMT